LPPERRQSDPAAIMRLRPLAPALLLCLAPLVLPGHLAADGTLSATLQPFLDQTVLVGAVTLVADPDRVLDVTTVGQADLGSRRAMQADDLFWIASMTKPITAAAFLMLVDEGKVHLDDPITRYLPEFKDQMVITEKDAGHILLRKPTHPVLVRHLLSHTAGFDFSSPIEKPTLDANPLRVAVLSYAAQPLLWEPGKRYKYSNAGINTAARILEVVTGQTYEAFLQARLLDPLGMNDTTFWPTESQAARLATSYRATKDKSGLEATPVTQLSYPLTDRVRRHPMPAGGLFSTAADCAKFGQLLLNGGSVRGRRLLSVEAVRQMTTRQTPADVKESYGFGLQLDATGHGHGGAYSTNLHIDPARGLVTVFMVQNAGWRTDAGKQVEPAFRAAVAARFGR
jgi:CubicO group peptidase (beta-lactamase class C family)